MNDLIQTGFDYAALPVDLAISLKLHEDRFIAVRNRATYEMGKEIYEAQQELASHDKTQGQFGAWVESLGITRQTGYDLITLFQGVGSDVVKLFDNKKLSQTVSVMLLRSPDSVVQQAIEKAESGEKVTVDWVKERKQIESKLESERQRREAAERALYQSSVRMGATARDKPGKSRLLTFPRAHGRNDCADFSAQLAYPVTAPVDNSGAANGAANATVRKPCAYMGGVAGRLTTRVVKSQTLRVHGREKPMYRAGRAKCRRYALKYALRTADLAPPVAGSLQSGLHDKLQTAPELRTELRTTGSQNRRPAPPSSKRPPQLA